MGAGQLDLDLTKLAPSNLQADIEGGAGQARIHLPKDVGVRVFASGGIGAVNADGLTRQGDAYVNAAYGKSAKNIEMNVHGGVGEIDLIEGD
jgi:predicted membrane protein